MHLKSWERRKVCWSAFMAGRSLTTTPVAVGEKPHNSLPCMRHGDKPCHRHPGIPRFQSWEVSSEQNDIKKSHVNDARCISKHPLAKPCSVCYRTKAIRHHNRQIHKAKILKGGIRKANQAPYIVKGFRLWDKVLYNEQECFISGRRSSGYFALRKFDGTTITNSISFKKLRLLEPATNYLIERK